ncbi:23S rRNA (adenine(2030)-N(6))-methyltransferase RlmJ [Prosthecomicrobium sp. N25]|uniref:23S rRNA (adenine(2030)-N(6))-methyltransferase RlmJ n=1 Tax=Prosthecomicrobium sp. N25 TaxID=3129254 RepID=UPI00307844B4
MNYRHAYHAGNFADVLKHAVLTRLIVLLQKKDAPFRILDTHAGVGVYDLAAPEAEKTGEWRTGIARLLAAAPQPDVAALLAPYLGAVRAANSLPSDPAAAAPPAALQRYPGSPLLARSLMRRVDRLTLTELHPADAAALSALFAGDVQVRVVELDGWLALKSFLPPKERRGLVLVDPPFEAPGEFDRLVGGLAAAHRRFATGVYALWYPIKDEAEVARFARALVASGLRRLLRVELRTRAVEPGRPLSGCGLVLLNPPWTLDDELGRLAPALARILAEGPGAGARVDWLVTE